MHFPTKTISLTHSFPIRYSMKSFRFVLYCLLCLATRAFQVGIRSQFSSRAMSRALLTSQGEEEGYQTSKTDEQENKFGFFQRIESVKCLAVGVVTGSIALAPFALVHDLLLVPSIIDTNGLAQFEFDSDAAALQNGLFAIVYRYCIRTDTNPQLQDGVVGAFALTRALSRVVVPPSCNAIPLYCKFSPKAVCISFRRSDSCMFYYFTHKGGPPLGYLDWSLLSQLAVNGVESFAMFTATATAINYCMERNIISKFE